MNQPLSSPHLPVRPTVGGLMRRVLLAMIPGAAAMVICFGIGVLINLLVALAAALIAEHYDPRYARQRARHATGGVVLETEALDPDALDRLADRIVTALPALPPA
mgnify:CR=1 FL=1